MIKQHMITQQIYNFFSLRDLCLTEFRELCRLCNGGGGGGGGGGGFGDVWVVFVGN